MKLISAPQASEACICLLFERQLARPRFCRSVVSALLLLLHVAALRATAESRATPFDAVVNNDKAFVRSGPGNEDYYPTQQLKRGERIKVIREDYGGWYMIAPPEGSFSWIRAEHVKRQGLNKAIVTEDTMDRIGSSLNRSDWSIIHQVSKGEVVEVIGQTWVTSGVTGKSVQMFQIRPPRGEYRYISRRDVVPADEFQPKPGLLASSQADRQARNRNSVRKPKNNKPNRKPQNETTGPFGPIQSESLPGTVTADPDFGGRDLTDGSRELPDQPVVQMGPTKSAIADSLPGSADQGIATPGSHFEAPRALSEPELSDDEKRVIESAWQRVQNTDSRFRQMIRRPAEEWNLGSLRSSYQQSLGVIRERSLQRQIEMRIAAVDRYERLFKDQIAIARIMQQTETRDTAIRESYIAKWHSVSTKNPPVTRVLKNAATPARLSEPVPAPAAEATPWSPSRTAQPSPTQSRTSISSRKFAGAGIIQRSALSRQGLPKFVLLAPDGRVLSYLQAGEGIDLDKHIGRPVGVNGPRGFRRELNADMMIVNSISPVQLRP